MTDGPTFAEARLEDLAELLAFVDAECERIDAPDAAAFALRLAAEEAFTNIVRHGYTRGPGPVRSTLDHDHRAITLTLIDESPPFDPHDSPAPDLEAALEDRQEGGLGWHLVLQLMDEVHYRAATPRGNVLRLIKHLGDDHGD